MTSPTAADNAPPWLVARGPWVYHWHMAFLVLLLVVLAPSAAHAWGPVTHLTHGALVLEGLGLIGIALQRLLRDHRLEFLYGCIGADITLAKKYTRDEQAHCHSWDVGWAVLEGAQSDAQRAFAYGYLTHLAGDVVSHNHYVPLQTILSYKARGLGHIYWEARFDTMQTMKRRALVAEMRAHKFPECDALVERVVSRTLFPFATDKRIFEYFIAIHDLGQWHKIVASLARNSRYRLSPSIVKGYNRVCSQNATDVLIRGKDADCQSEDPTGENALASAERIRAALRAMQGSGSVPRALSEQVLRMERNRDVALPCCQPLLAV